MAMLSLDIVFIADDGDCFVRQKEILANQHIMDMKQQITQSTLRIVGDTSFDHLLKIGSRSIMTSRPTERQRGCSPMLIASRFFWYAHVRCGMERVSRLPIPPGLWG